MGWEEGYMSSEQAVGVFAPLRIKRLRMMLGFQLCASVGVWILVLAVQWTFAETGESATTVSMVQFAASLPFFLLALPIGAMAEFVSHRLLLVGTAMVLAASTIVLSSLQQLGLAKTPILMLAVFVAGAGLASVAIVWQALLPSMVSREMMAVVPAIDGAVFNGARAVGPVIGGAVLTGWGSTSAFALTAALFAVCALVAARTVPASAGRVEAHSSIGQAVVGSVRFIRHSRWTRRLLLRLTMFGVPASCLWGLLPLVAHDRMHVSTFGFGILSGAIGIGAVLGTILLMPLRARMSWNHFVALGSVAYGLVLIGLVVIPSVSAMFGVLVVAGAAWVGVQSTWMIAAHAVVPRWIKARVIAFVMLMFQGSQAVGALLWGILADSLGLVPAVLLAALLMFVSVFETLRRGIMPSEAIAPESTGAPDPLAPRAEFFGLRVIVETTYHVHPGRVEEFLDNVHELKLSRRRLGALRWSVSRSADEPDIYVEHCTFRDWSEYLAQETERLTVPENRVRTKLAEYLARVPQTRVLIEPKLF